MFWVGQGQIPISFHQGAQPEVQRSCFLNIALLCSGVGNWAEAGKPQALLKSLNPQETGDWGEGVAGKRVGPELPFR